MLFLLTSLGVRFPVLANLGSHLTRGQGSHTPQGSHEHWMSPAFEKHLAILKSFMHMKVLVGVTSLPLFLSPGMPPHRSPDPSPGQPLPPP